MIMSQELTSFKDSLGCAGFRSRHYVTRITNALRFLRTDFLHHTIPGKRILLSEADFRQLNCKSQARHQDRSELQIAGPAPRQQSNCKRFISFQELLTECPIRRSECRRPVADPSQVLNLHCHKRRSVIHNSASSYVFNQNTSSHVYRWVPQICQFEGSCRFECDG